MSIIEKICEFEEELVQKRSEGNQKVLEIKNSISIKKDQIKEQFEQEFQEQKKQLQKEMLDHIEEYKKSLIVSSIDIKKVLHNKYQQKKEDILSQIYQYFWKE